MFNAVDYPAQNLLRFTIAGQLTQADYAGVVPTLDAKVKRWGKVNVCLEIGEMDAITLPALWEELKQDAQHFNDFNRAAIIGDGSLLLKAAAAVTGTFTPAEVRHFPAGQQVEALRWALGADPSHEQTVSVYQS